MFNRTSSAPRIRAGGSAPRSTTVMAMALLLLLAAGCGVEDAPEADADGAATAATADAPAAVDQPPPDIPSLSPSAAGSYDLTSVDAVIEALYASISGPAGQPRDWDLFHSLMHPTAARLISVDMNAEGEAVHNVMTSQGFVDAANGGLVSNGFYEEELGFSEDRFGNIVHRFSSYDSKRTPGDAEPFSRGINSIQLLWSEGRWWVVTILWDRERPDNMIPGELGGE